MKNPFKKFCQRISSRKYEKLRYRNAVMRVLTNIYYSGYRDRISLREVQGMTKYSYGEIVQIATCLESKHYIQFLSDRITKEKKHSQDGSIGVVIKKNTSPIYVRLTDDGQAYFANRRDIIFRFIRNSILTPIFVSVLTTLVLYLSRNWLQPKLEWLLSFLGL